MFAQNIVLNGRLSEQDWRAFLADFTKSVGMTTAGEAAVWRYPTSEGKGGVGMTICQPITESFIVIDTWPDHDGAYLHFASCVRFDPATFIAPINRAGLAIGFVGQFEALRL